jgi:serine/threonine-protein kinase HipA
MGQTEVNEGFRRMAFNLAARNQDDHVKNLAFLMAPDGRWQLAPAFDVTWAYGGQWSRTHQMTVRGKDDDFTREDLLAVGKEFDVPNGGASILEAIDAALHQWKSEAQAVDLDADWITRIEQLFRHFA